MKNSPTGKAQASRAEILAGGGDVAEEEVAKVRANSPARSAPRRQERKSVEIDEVTSWPEGPAVSEVTELSPKVQ